MMLRKGVRQMRYSLLGSLIALLAGANLAAAQPWAGSKPVTTPDTSSHGSSLPPPVWSKPDVTAEPCCDVKECEPVHGGKFWMSAGYRLWWLKSSPSPQALVTTSTGEFFPPGAIGNPDTVILYGAGDIDYKPYSGGWITVGYALDDFQRCAVEASFFALASREELFERTSDEFGFPVLARPFFSSPPEFDVNGNPLFPGEDVHLVAEPGNFVAEPGNFAGTVRVRTEADVFGAEINLAKSCVDVGPLAVDGLVGFRYMYLHEELNIRDRTTSIGGDVFFDIDGDGDADQVVTIDDPFFGPSSIGAVVRTNDVFETTNNFFGGQIGLRGEYSCGAFYIAAKTKVAIGVTHSSLRISGSSQVFNPTTGETFFTDQGGVLALATNIGEHSKDSFAVIPEAEISVGFHLTENLRIYAGYSFVYWSDVMRPGEQIDHTINPVFLPTSDAFGPAAGGPARPRVLLETTDFWLHGISAGFAFHW
jgi:hypothetical protein